MLNSPPITSGAGINTPEDVFCLYSFFRRPQHTLCRSKENRDQKENICQEGRPTLPLGYILRERVSMVDGAFRFSLPRLSLELMRVGEAPVWPK